MILDKLNLFSEKQALTESAASTNVIDLGADDAKMPVPNLKGHLNFLAQVVTAFADGTSVKFGLQTSAAEAFSSPITVVESGAIAVADLVAGYQAFLAADTSKLKRYVRMYYTVVGTPTAGKVTAGIVLDRQLNG